MAKEGVIVMTEFQKIAVGLLGMSHPEIHRFRTPAAEPDPSRPRARVVRRTPASKPTPTETTFRGLKFALAALLAGARAIPLGDNGRITRELGEYGAHLKGC
jgi:hypothetical protein